MAAPASLGLPRWTLAAPAAAWLALALPGAGGGLAALAMAAALVAGVLAAVHHAEVVAHRVGEPFGTLILAIAVTVIEASLIVSLMLAGGPATSALARDTVFAAVMIILNGIVGLCLLWGGSHHHEQQFSLQGAAASLTTLAAIVVLALVLPNYLTTALGPVYSLSQLVFIAIVSLILYGAFVFVQTVRHRDYFLPQHAASSEAHHAPPPANRTALASLALLMVCLGAVVLLAKALSPALERAVATAGAPAALVGVIIAAVVLLPEGLAALRAARADRLQTSLNLALGSALATIGLTIPVVAVTSILLGFPLTLGIDGRSTVLLLLSLFVTSLSLSTGRTTVLQGTILLVLFAVYLFTSVVP
ncbi:MAG: ionic transporter y4hA [Betaproteobacteria bacterium]|nr:ionic transporter y4hA [Betaproteobacteria bacterium]